MNMNTNASSKNGIAKKLASPLVVGAIAVMAMLTWQRSASSAEAAVPIAAPLVDEPAVGVHTETAVFAGGCFWGVQGVFQHVRGVTEAISGYAGGRAGTAHYEDVAGGDTGHAESVRVTFDPTQVSYGHLLQVFFSVAPESSQHNRQGPDSGTQYRSAVFPITPAQRKVADAYISQIDAAHAFKAPLVTKVENYSGFYPAESYHQNYLTQNPGNPYIAINDLPKVENLKRVMPAVYRAEPVLVKTY